MNQGSGLAPRLHVKTPRTERGRRTLQKILDAAAVEFGDRGFHEAAISSITNRAGVALGTFYVYFESKDAIFRSLVAHMGELTRHFIAARVADSPNRLAAEREGVAAFIEFVRVHKNLYRIIMEAQFVAPDAYREHYETFADAYARRLNSATKAGEIRPGDDSVRSWALMGMSVFLGLRFAVWDEKSSAEKIAAVVGEMIENGLAEPTASKTGGNRNEL
jgi:AcrR family transcriptional regulator